MELKEPSEVEKSLRDNLIKEFPKNFVAKLGKDDRQRLNLFLLKLTRES